MNNGSADIPLQGLSEREAATGLKVDGPNALPQPDRRSLGSSTDRAGLSRARSCGSDGSLDLCRPAITPSHSFRRFNTRFFLSDGNNVFGEPMASEELEDVG
jgi:hypothetical protein